MEKVEEKKKVRKNKRKKERGLMLTLKSMDVPVVTKNKPSNKPLKGRISASTCVR
jgi:hypothetical protein